MAATKTRIDNSRRSAIQPENSSYTDVLARISQAAVSCNSRENILSEISLALLSATSAGVVFHFKIDPITNQCESKVLATRYSKIPENLEQWAASVSMKSLASRAIETDVTWNHDSNPVQLVAAPICDSIKTGFETIAVMFIGNSVDSNMRYALMQSLQTTVSGWDRNQQLAHSNQIANELAAISELVLRIGKSKSPESASQRLAKEIEQHIGLLICDSPLVPAGETNDIHCPIVYVALADDQDNINLAAISNADTIPQDTRLIELVTSAMRECYCRNKNSQWPPGPTDRHALLCHRQLAQQPAHSNLISVPLNDVDGKLQGVILVASETPLPDRAQSFLRASAAPISCLLSLTRQAQKNKFQLWLTKTLEAIREKKFKTACKVLVVLCCLTLIPMPYTVCSRCEIQPSIKRFIAAPFNGKLRDCLIEPGDTVSQDQILAHLDDREIKLELAEIDAELHRAIKMHDGHIATHESGEARVAHFEAERLRARDRLLHYRINNLALKSPVNGVVISGDLKKSVGMPLETGQSLFEIAPLEELVIELSIPEDDIRYVESGMLVNFRLDAFPFESFEGTIDRVHPSAEIRDNDNVFVATVMVANESGKLRPGMQGNAKTKTAWRPICWNLLHKPVAKALRWFGW